jgi:predicted dehydrogenase
VRWAIDTDGTRTARVAEIQGNTAQSSELRKALQDDAVHAVDLCLPHDLHRDFAIEALQAGKHVLCEKPIAAALAEADEMIAAADSAGRILMIAENEVFSPLYRKTRDLIWDGVIGKPSMIQMTRGAFLEESFKRERPWFLNAKAAAGGMMMSGGVHDFEKLRMLVGEVESVYALRAPQRFMEMEGDDTSVATVRFQNGVVGTMIQSFLYKNAATLGGPEYHTARVDGDRGSITVTGTHGGTIRVYSEDETFAGEDDFVEHEIYVPEQNTFSLEIAHFIDCIKNDRRPITEGKAMRRPLELVLAAYRSMETGAPVSV